MKIAKPYKQCQPNQLTQGYGVNIQSYQPTGHTGNDWAFANCYGTFLVAPEDVEVISLIDAKNISPDLAPLSRGYGILMRSVKNPERTHLYWHCLPVFPVEEGEVCLQGEPVAQMGNSGFVTQGGKIVPISDRLKPPYYGTHLHQEIRIDGKYTDPFPWVDWDIEVQGVGLTTLQKIINKIINLLWNS